MNWSREISDETPIAVVQRLLLEQRLLMMTVVVYLSPVWLIPFFYRLLPGMSAAFPTLLGLFLPVGIYLVCRRVIQTHGARSIPHAVSTGRARGKRPRLLSGEFLLLFVVVVLLTSVVLASVVSLL